MRSPGRIPRSAEAVEAVLDLPVVELRDRLAAGAVRAAEVADAVNARIARLDPDLRAFVHHDAATLARTATMLDAHRTSQRPLGRLHGLPVALKDVIDTRDMPTENGAAADAGRRPDRDATLVELLRREGALIVGKTATAELAYLAPPATRNPHDAALTPGGSSSGSAVAVAASMVPLAVGTQTGGSVIRPAAFCGTVGYKPTFGAIPRTGVLSQSPSLDTIGVFAREIEGAALLASSMFGPEPGADALPVAAPDLLAAARTVPPVEPTFAILRTPWWDQVDDATRAAWNELEGVLGAGAFAIDLPEPFPRAVELRRMINDAEMARAFARYARHPEALSDELRAALERGARVLAHDYLAALEWRDAMRLGLASVFERCDAVLTPAAPGIAPDRSTTGSSAFNALWTMVGAPALTLPLMSDERGLPLGIQMVSRPGDDARLVRNAAWLERRLEAGS